MGGCVAPLPAGTPDGDEHLHLVNEVGEVILDPKGRRLSDLEYVQPRLALSLGMPAACSNPSRGSQQTTRESLRAFPTPPLARCQTILVPLWGSSEKNGGSRL